MINKYEAKMAERNFLVNEICIMRYNNGMEILENMHSMTISELRKEYTELSDNENNLGW